MYRFVHMINPVRPKEGQDFSDLALAQPVTFASLKAAMAASRQDVRILAACFEEDIEIVPEFVELAPVLSRSVLDLADFEVPRKLPILADLIARLAAGPMADFYVYTNIDIGVQAGFYDALARLIDQGFDAFTITRRTIPRKFSKPEDLPLISALVGEQHPGEDCFVFSREILEKMILADTCVGARYLVPPLMANMVCHGRKFRRFREFHLTFHLGDDRAWITDRFRDYADFNFREAARTLQLMNEAEVLVRAPLVKEWIDRFAPDIAFPESPVRPEASWLLQGP